MVNHESLVGGTVGTMVSALSINVDDLHSIESIVAIVCTVLGLLITIITSLIIPLCRWYAQSKKDGKISADEVVEGAETLKNGLQDIQNKLEDKSKQEDHK